MKNIEFLWLELIYGGHWFSISISAIIFSIILLLDTSIRWELLIISYLLIQSLFNYNHYKEFHTDMISASIRAKHLKKYYNYIPIIMIFYLLLLVILTLFYGNITSMIFLFFLFIIGILFTKVFKKQTKKIIGFKTFYTAFTLSLFVVFFTALYCSYQFNLLLIELYIYFSFRFFIGTSFSDIKDMKTDKKNKLMTLPIYYGKNKFLNFLHILNFMTIVPLSLTIIEVSKYFILLVIFTFFYNSFYIERAKSTNADIPSLTDIIVDGEFIFWPFLIFVGKILWLYN